jgi:predicted MFS family arabinose efflux permease
VFSGRESAVRMSISVLPAGLREINFRRYWIASTASVFGDGVSSLAIPLTAVAVLHASPLDMGCLGALVWAPSLVFSVHAGAWIDRRGQRRYTMMTADGARFLLLASIPASYALHILTLPQLFLVVLGVGFFSVLFNVSNSALFGFLVAPDEYVEAQSLLYGGQQVASLGGPSAAGFIVQAITAPLAIIVDAASFLVSAILLSQIRSAEPSRPHGDASGSVTEGMRFIRSNRIIASILATTATINLFTSITQALYVIYVIRDLHATTGALGFFLGASALGGIIGSLIAVRISRRFGIGRALILGCILYGVPDIVIPLTRGSFALVCALLIPQALVTGLGVVLENISIGTIFATVVPALKRATVRGSFQAISFGVRPLGALLGGVIGDELGVRPALWVGALGAAVSFLWILFSPTFTFRTPVGRPDQQPTAAPENA